MLERLAQIANLLDDAGLYSDADKLTMVLDAVAQRTAGLLDDDEYDGEDHDYTFPGQELRWHDRDSIDAFDPDFQAEFKDKNPTGWNSVAPELEKARRGGNVGEKWMHGTPINFSKPGYMSAIGAEDLAQFLYPHDELERNKEEIDRRFNGITRNKRNRGTLMMDYASGSGPEPEEKIEDFRARSHEPRRVKFDPHLLEKYYAQGGRQLPGKMPLFDSDKFDALFNPTHESFNSEDPMFKLSKPDAADFGKGDVSPEELRGFAKDRGRDYGWLGGFAQKDFGPEQTFGLKTFKRPMDEATGRKRPNFYTDPSSY